MKIENNNLKQHRNYNIDFLKCLSMLFVVLLHICNYGLKDVSYASFGYISCTKALMQGFSCVGVNCFVLITGYYLCKKTVSLKKQGLWLYYKRLLPLWGQVLFYSLGMYMILCIVPNLGVQFSFREVVQQALPLMTNQYWFFTVYFLIIIVSPFYNTLINSLARNEYRTMIIVLILIFSFIPMLNVFGDTFGTEYGYSIVWFSIVYLVSGYLRRFQLKTRYYGVYYILLSLALSGGQLFLNVFPSLHVSSFIRLSVNPYNSIFVFASAICLFLSFVNKKNHSLGVGRVVSFISALSFGVYLFHEHPYVRDVLWYRIVKFERFENNELMNVIYMLGVALAVYILGLLIDYVRMILCRAIVFVFRCFRLGGK